MKHLNGHIRNLPDDCVFYVFSCTFTISHGNSTIGALSVAVYRLVLGYLCKGILNVTTMRHPTGCQHILAVSFVVWLPVLGLFLIYTTLGNRMTVLITHSTRTERVEPHVRRYTVLGMCFTDLILTSFRRLLFPVDLFSLMILW